MKKLVYILILMFFCSCLVTKKYEGYKFKNGGTIYENYEDHHWVGEYNEEKYKVIVKNVNEHQKSFSGQLIINNDTGKFGVGKLHLFFPGRDNRDTSLGNKLLKYNRLTSNNCDTIFLFYRYKENLNQVNSHIRIPLIKTENKYFKPYINRKLLQKQEYYNFSIIENNGLEGYPVAIGYGNLYKLKNNSEIISIADGEVISVESVKDNRNGNSIIIKHNDSITSFSLNLKKIKVKIGEKVSKGQIIGYYSAKNKGFIKDFGFILYHNDTSKSPTIIFENN